MSRSWSSAAGRTSSSPTRASRAPSCGSRPPAYASSPTTVVEAPTCGSRPASRGTTSWPTPSSRAGPGSRRSRASRVRPAPRRSRTSAPTARRSRRPSPRSGRGTAATGEVRTLFGSDCGFTYRDSRFKRDPSRYVVLDVLFQLRVADLSEPVRYADSPGPRGRAGRTGAAGRRARRVLEQRRAGAWCSTRRPRHVELRVVLHQPDPAAADMDALADRVRDRLGEGAPDLPMWPEPDGRRKTSAAWLIERAGFAKGSAHPVRRRCRTSTPWP